jgi:predicted nucleotidyltransferase
MDPRKEVAKEAARLLYIGVVEEYKHAKEVASENLGLNIFPSNHEVAFELDQLVDREEGEARIKRLKELRELALEIMKTLKYFEPRLMGSVWRGTTHIGSDIDIDVYSNTPKEIEERLKQSGYRLKKIEEKVVVNNNQTFRSWHIHIKFPNNEAEVVVRPLDAGDQPVRCEIYGDLKKGLTLEELEKLMRTEPLRKFVPRRRYK